MALDFRSLHVVQRIGIPTARLECDFVAPSELGDELTIQVSPVRVGGSSRSVDWPDNIGPKLRAQV